MRSHVITEGSTAVSEIVVGRSLAAAISDAAAQGRTKAAVLCQPSTVHLAEAFATDLRSVGMDVTGYTLPDGEEAKQLSVVETVYRMLNERSFTRNDVVLGVGGGALTDVTGFIAATYLRGLSAMYVTTTLLGAVDAAIGGKTAVNVDGKNLAGVFSHPEKVFIDIDVLDALPNDLKVQGAAEAIKTGFIADMEIANAFDAGISNVDLESVVNKAVAVKVAVVNDDSKEHGRRAILNYGHTVGHAIEVATPCSHGEAVSIGMVAAGAASASLLGFGGADHQRALLSSIGLPVAAGVNVKSSQLRALIAMDKKRDSSGLRMVLLERFESPVVVSVDDATVRTAFDAIGLDS
ncbi:MAG: 3-dehydroquinate synthase [Actinomycetota bacterium]|nr:3-dehydroquinate synthase [Actinomycetota bacterium]